MFGTVVPKYAALDAATRDVLKHAYRSVCLHLGRISPLAKACLSNDVAVMAALIDPGRYRVRPGQSNSCFERLRCVDQLSHFAACLSILMAKLRLQDGVRDEGRLLHRAGLTAMRRVFRTADKEMRRIGFPMDDVLGHQEHLLCMERDGSNLDIADYAQPVGQCYAIAYRFAASIAGQDEAVWERVGDLIGSLTYLIDCERDLVADSRTGIFNPLLLPAAMGSKDSARESWIAELEQICTGIQGDILRGCMEQIRASVSACFCTSTSVITTLPSRLYHKSAELLKLLWRPSKPSSSTVLYCTACIPCGDGGVAVDSDECGNVCLACCFLIICCSCVSKGGC